MQINLSDNDIRKLPNDLSLLNHIIELNLTGNPIDNLQLAVESLVTMPLLENLHINLHQEEEVDFLLRNLPNLLMLNGLVVERDAIFSDEGESELLDQNEACSRIVETQNKFEKLKREETNLLLGSTDEISH